jgi:hypothetical protein
MAKFESFVVCIPVEGEEPLRGKFTVKVKLSVREMLEMDQVRRGLLGPQAGEPDALAAYMASNLARIRTHATETPSWWKEAGNGLEFDDINVIMAVSQELDKVEKSHLADLKARAEKAKLALATESEKE